MFQQHNYDNFVLRFLYKHNQGVLWCYNKPNIDKPWFKEVPNTFGAGVKENIRIET